MRWRTSCDSSALQNCNVGRVGETSRKHAEPIFVLVLIFVTFLRWKQNQMPLDWSRNKNHDKHSNMESKKITVYWIINTVSSCARFDQIFARLTYLCDGNAKASAANEFICTLTINDNGKSISGAGNCGGKQSKRTTRIITGIKSKKNWLFRHRVAEDLLSTLFYLHLLVYWLVLFCKVCWLWDKFVFTHCDKHSVWAILHNE